MSLKLYISLFLLYVTVPIKQLCTFICQWINGTSISPCEGSVSIVIGRCIKVHITMTIELRFNLENGKNLDSFDYHDTVYLVGTPGVLLLGFD